MSDNKQNEINQKMYIILEHLLVDSRGNVFMREHIEELCKLIEPDPETNIHINPDGSIITEGFKEKDRRIYYQDIVYAVCNLLDLSMGGRIVCGTVDHPSTQLQDKVTEILVFHKIMMHSTWESSKKIERERAAKIAENYYSDVDHEADAGTGDAIARKIRGE